MMDSTQKTWKTKPKRPHSKATDRTTTMASPETLRSRSNEEMRRDSGDLLGIRDVTFSKTQIPVA
jgi:hypothetical protein